MTILILCKIQYPGQLFSRYRLHRINRPDIDLTIAGHAFMLNEVAVKYRAEGFGYIVSGWAGSWITRTVHSEQELVASVPERGSLALLLAGIGAVATVPRRRHI